MDTVNNYQRAFCNSCNNAKAKSASRKALLTRAVILFSVAIGTYFFSIIELCLKNYSLFAGIAVAGLIPFAYGVSYYFKYKTFKSNACTCKQQQQTANGNIIADYDKLALEASAI
jgi:hypothetical protein